MSHNSVLAQCCSNGINLLENYNPHFSIPGNPIPPGFDTDNTYSVDLGAGLYSVIVSRNYGACALTPEYDHTSGDETGNYLWYDTGFTASAANPEIAWRPYDPNRPPGQEYTLDVSPNTTYVFSCWIRDLARNTDCVSGGAPIMGLRINGVDMAEINLGDYITPCCPEWIYLCSEWNSGNETEVAIQIESRTGIGFTDLGIDDVFFGTTFPNQEGLLGPDISTCSFGDVMLYADINYGVLTWSDGSHGDSLLVTEPGIYWVDIDQEGCVGRDSIVIVENSAGFTISLGPDISSCINEQLLLSVSSSATGSVLWNTNATTQSITVNQSGQYWASLTNDCGQDADTINVIMINPVEFELGPDLQLCDGNTITLSVNSSNADVFWSNGSTASAITINSPGTYSVTLDNGCESEDSIEIFATTPPQLSLPDSVKLCEGETFLIDAGNDLDQYQWFDGSQNSFFNATNSGLVWVEKFNDCGAVKDSTWVLVEPLMMVEPLHDVLICNDETLTIDLFEYPIPYVWSDGVQSAHRELSAEGIYTVSLSSHCATTSSTFKLDTRPCNCAVYVPNSFTPDRDGFNEVFIPKSDCDFTQYRLRIYNRWGVLFFSTDDPSEPWVGEVADYYAPDGIYQYVLTYQFDTNEPEEVRGFIALIR